MFQKRTIFLQKLAFVLWPVAIAEIEGEIRIGQDHDSDYSEEPSIGIHTNPRL